MFSVNPLKLISSYWHKRMLISQLVTREIKGKFQGTHLDFLWVFLEPMLMLSVYTFVFRVIFNRHWHSKGESILEFGIILFSGLLIFNLFRDTINSAPKLIFKNVNYVKKVVFPLEILPVVSLLTGLYHLCASLLILGVLYFLVYGQLHLEVIYIPVVILPYVLMIFGASLFLASIGVYFRDIAQLIAMLVMATLFLSAVFYPIDSVPEQYRIWFYLNPVAFTIDQFRGLVILGRMPSWEWLAYYYPASMVFSWLGLFWFQKTRHGFSDVL